MEKRVVLTVAMDVSNGATNIFFGDGIDIPKETKPGSNISMQLGGGLSLPIMLNMFMTTFATMKNQIMENPALKNEDKLAMEQEIYDMLNIAIGTYLDRGFPLVNEHASLTEEACVEYNLDPKTATAEELLEAENKFITEHPDRAAKTADMQLEKPIKTAKEI